MESPTFRVPLLITIASMPRRPFSLSQRPGRISSILPQASQSPTIYVFTSPPMEITWPGWAWDMSTPEVVMFSLI